MKKVLNFVSNLFGFNKLSKYENDYLHDANIRSSSYMGFIVVVLEIWMLIRQTISKIIPKMEAGGNTLSDLLIKYTSKYWLFMLIGLGVMLFCMFYDRSKKLTKPKFISLMVVGSLSVLYTLVLTKESFMKADQIGKTEAAIMNTMLISIYVLLFVIGASIIIYSSFKFFKNTNVVILEHFIITGFSLICLAFGIFVSYSDFMGGKGIICFLTMVIYVGCLLIYRPFVTTLLLSACFISFYYILLTYNSGASFKPAEVTLFDNLIKYTSGDTVNYITFYISLTTICFAIYHGRLNEARKSLELKHTAEFDELTEIYNYSYFTELAKAKLLGYKNLDDKIFLFLDIHNFKAFNDQRGFEEGNRFLTEVGKFISAEFTGDLYARQGDDHFVILTNKDNLIEKLEIINKKVHEYDSEILLSINAGAYNIQNNNEDPRQCIDRARYATHLIKNRFQKIYIEYDKSMSEAYRKRLYVINNIDTAVENGWIVPYYQPVVWSDNNELCGCEALARWIDPVYGQLYPSDFIPVLEEYRLIHKLDKSIFESVCRDIRSSLDNGLPVVPVSLNFSRLDFELMDAVSELKQIVKKYNISKDLIHVEVTESALTDNFELINKALNKIKDLGYALWLDDFGSGYSSLNVLKDYQFDVVKLDMSFLKNLETNEKSRILIDSIIKMADRINMLTLTEGVETQIQAKFLNEVGCTRLQGYLFGKPIPKDELYNRINAKDIIVSNNPLAPKH